MPYADPIAKKNYDMRYAKEKLKRIPLNVKNDYFENVLKPAADQMDMALNTFIKVSIMEKIEREDLKLPTDKYKP